MEGDSHARALQSRPVGPPGFFRNLREHTAHSGRRPFRHRPGPTPADRDGTRPGISPGMPAPRPVAARRGGSPAGFSDRWRSGRGSRPSRRRCRRRSASASLRGAPPPSAARPGSSRIAARRAPPRPAPTDGFRLERGLRFVVISVPRTADTGSTHDLVATPLTCTVHAPHWAMPHPYLVPLSSRTSRSTQSSGMSGATSTVVDFPLTLKVTGMAGVPSIGCAKPAGSYVGLPVLNPQAGAAKRWYA